MSNNQLKTPVAFLIFNRPDTTKRVFEAIRAAKPPKLLVIADGPRADRSGEAEKCEACRAIIDGVDWQCEVIKNYSDVNMGCGLRVSSGISWVFEQLEEAIILEDDCYPNPTFFQFCEIMLAKYRHDERIMMISGTNYLEEWKSDIQSYHFSYYGGIWGWASWARAWKYYDYDMKLWAKSEVQNRIRDIISNDDQYQNREKVFWQTYNKKIDTWDYQWGFARLSQSGLSIVPAVNLISNLGFGEDATHTKYSNSQVAEMKTLSLKIPIESNDITVVDRDYDRKLFNKLIRKTNLFNRVKMKVLNFKATELITKQN
ncbi:glycosyltransferase family 2 protein [Nostoc sp. CENA67]|uniref:Glycosyltransferase family 2 protein n=1 Tax=Amazonocrinis nigriterrae CENA67 TaxID=2794033 RepID=A0A8J7HXQ7_9NOST|nr:glycosyltransferase family 2 protein [Amazonocrinis nigriterrae]MBH8566265.1 glycosyltransferase family 2 protein [Amazonocrinis nigriterrae CENA67]